MPDPAALLVCVGTRVLRCFFTLAVCVRRHGMRRPLRWQHTGVAAHTTSAPKTSGAASFDGSQGVGPAASAHGAATGSVRERGG